MRSFNTAGPVNPTDHYLIAPLSRIDLDEVLGLVRDKKYFVLHAPRQTGKTSALLALVELLNGRGYRCVYATVETARTARDDVQRAMRTVLVRLASQARATLDYCFLDDIWPDVLARVGADEALGEALSRWAHASPGPLVLLIDEIDTLVGDSLLSVVAQETLDLSPPRYVTADGSLDAELLMAEFQSFFRRHSEHWRNRFAYAEAWPQLLLQAYLQRVVNGGGRIEREYALGSGRVDLLIVWPLAERVQEFVVECKVVRDGLESVVAEGVEQTARYVDRCAAEAGHLIVIDARRICGAAATPCR